jgi:hypothetical protein
MSPRTSAPTFPPNDDARAAADLPARADTSHVARRRASSAPAHEVDLDEVELFDDAPPQPVPWAAPASSLPLPSFPDPSLEGPDGLDEAPVSAVRATTPPAPADSIALPALESQAPFSVPITVGVVRRRSWVAIAASYALLAVAVGTVTGLVARPHAAAHAGPPKAAAQAPDRPLATPSAESITTTTSSVVAAPTAPTSPEAVPVVDVAKLPRARDGQIIGASGHRLWIDGSLATTWQVSIACGPHVVQVGSAGTPHTVEVPCGESVTVAP